MCLGRMKFKRNSHLLSTKNGSSREIISNRLTEGILQRLQNTLFSQF